MSGQTAATFVPSTDWSTIKVSEVESLVQRNLSAPFFVFLGFGWYKIRSNQIIVIFPTERPMNIQWAFTPFDTEEMCRVIFYKEDPRQAFKKVLNLPERGIK